MKNRLISSIGFLAIFLMCILPPNQITSGRAILYAPGIVALLYGILNIALFIGSLVGVVIFVTMCMKKSVIPVIVDWVVMIIAVLFVIFRFIYMGGYCLYIPTTYIFIAGAVISAIFLLKTRK